MSVPAHISPSLARAFEPERRKLQSVLTGTDLTAAQIVAETRRALDRAGQTFGETHTDPAIHKTGLWLLEIVKAGAGVLDQGTGADIIWHEVTPPPKPKKRLGQGVFYAAAAALFIFSVLDGSRLGVITAASLATLRALDQDNFAALFQKLPFARRPEAIEDLSGRANKAEARITANTAKYISIIADSLRTADHILLRIAEPETETHWRHDQRLMALVQGLLEAARSDDGDFALKLISRELDTILVAEGIQQIEYSGKTADMFDVLPGIGGSGTQTAAPALIAGDEVVRRGTVWDSGDA